MARAAAEPIAEYIYPTEYEISKPKEDEQNEAHSAIVAPTAFETRSLGSIFEVEPILGEYGKTIDLTPKDDKGVSDTTKKVIVLIKADVVETAP